MFIVTFDFTIFGLFVSSIKFDVLPEFETAFPDFEPDEVTPEVVFAFELLLSLPFDVPLLSIPWLSDETASELPPAPLGAQAVIVADKRDTASNSDRIFILLFITFSPFQIFSKF
jgi:hypothetical protein